MHKLLTMLVALTALLPTTGGKREIIKPPLDPPPPVVMGDEIALPAPTESAERTDEARDTRETTREGETDTRDRYDALKQALDARYAHMFALGARLDKEQSELDARREEYYALRDRYNRELRKIVAIWATEAGYGTDAPSVTPSTREDEEREDFDRPVPYVLK